MTESTELEAMIVRAYQMIKVGPFAAALKTAEEMAKENPKEALELLAIALDIYPKERSGYAVGTLAFFHELVSDYAAASRLYEEAYSKSSIPDYMIKATKTSFLAQDYPRTDDLFEENKILQFNSDFWIAYMDYYFLKRDFSVAKLKDKTNLPKRRFEEAMWDFDDFLKRITKIYSDQDDMMKDMHMDDLLEHVAGLCMDIRKYDKSIDFYLNWLNNFGYKHNEMKQAEIHTQLGIAQRFVSRYNESMDSLNKAMSTLTLGGTRYDFGVHDIQAEQGITLLERDDYSLYLNTIYVLLHTAVISGHSPKAFIYLGQYYEKIRSFESALATYKAGADKACKSSQKPNPIAGQLCLKAGELAMKQNNFQEAKKLLEMAVAQNPDDKQAVTLYEAVRVKSR